MCSLCLPSTGDIDTLGAQCLSVDKDSNQVPLGGFSNPDYKACQIRWMYYGTFLLPTLLSSSGPSLTDILAYVLFCRLHWDF